MNRPGKTDDRADVYFVTPVRGEHSGVAGRYVGESGEYVILQFDSHSPARGYLWDYVEPVDYFPRPATED